MRSHPPEGRLMAYLDGEVAPWGWLLIRLHLVRCARCREVLSEVREGAEGASALLRSNMRSVDVQAAWARFVTRSGWRARRASRRAIAAGLVTVAAVGAASWLVRPSGGADCDLIPSGQGGAATIGQMTLRDVCCDDYDGGGYDDDGLLTLSAPDESVSFVIVYEDADRSGAYSAGDIQRFRSSRTCPRS